MAARTSGGRFVITSYSIHYTKLYDIADEQARLGRLRGPELAVAIVFALTAIAWIARPLIARVAPLVRNNFV